MNRNRQLLFPTLEEALVSASAMGKYVVVATAVVSHVVGKALLLPPMRCPGQTKPVKLLTASPTVAATVCRLCPKPASSGCGRR